jgi:hypothetical protein
VLELYVLGCAGIVALGALPVLWVVAKVWPSGRKEWRHDV